MFWNLNYLLKKLICPTLLSRTPHLFQSFTFSVKILQLILAVNLLIRLRRTWRIYMLGWFFYSDQFYKTLGTRGLDLLICMRPAWCAHQYSNLPRRWLKCYSNIPRRWLNCYNVHAWRIIPHDKIVPNWIEATNLFYQFHTRLKM